MIVINELPPSPPCCKAETHLLYQATSPVLQGGFTLTLLGDITDTHHSSTGNYTAVGGVDGTCGARVDGISSFVWTAIGAGSGCGCRLTHMR